MSLGLGVGLLKQGLSSSDGLSLDLAFALDKTLTARRGPTPTFTRASTATFIDNNGLIESAAIHEPRFDHDPVTLECRGLLIEEQRTNVLLNSDTLATQNVTVTAAARTLSFYGTGTVVLSGTHSATVVGTGAYPTRTTLTFTPTAGTLTLTVTGTVQFAQLEIGTFASSYIHTTTTLQIRSADVCSISSANFVGMSNNRKATILWESSVISGGENHNSPAFFIGHDNQNGIWVQQAPTHAAGVISNNETTQFNSSLSNTSSGALRKIAMAFDATGSGNAILCQNGTLGTQDNSVDFSDIQQGFYNVGLLLFEQQFSTIKSFRYYTKRLTNAKLQTLTTL